MVFASPVLKERPESGDTLPGPHSGDGPRRASLLLHHLIWPARITAIVVILVVFIVAGREALGPSDTPSASAGVIRETPTATVDVRSHLVGTWDEQGDDGSLLLLASDGLATLDVRAHDSTIWSAQGDFKVAGHDVTVTWLVDDDDADDYDSDAGCETFDYRDGVLDLPADGDVFVRQG